MTRNRIIAIALALATPLGGCGMAAKTLTLGAYVSLGGPRDEGPLPMGGTLTNAVLVAEEPVLVLALPFTLPVLLGLDALLLPFAIVGRIGAALKSEDDHDEDAYRRAPPDPDRYPTPPRLEAQVESEPAPTPRRETPEEIRERFRRERPFDALPELR